MCADGSDIFEAFPLGPGGIAVACGGKGIKRDVPVYLSDIEASRPDR